MLGLSGAEALTAAVGGTLCRGAGVDGSATNAGPGGDRKPFGVTTGGGCVGFAENATISPKLNKTMSFTWATALNSLERSTSVALWS